MSQVDNRTNISVRIFSQVESNTPPMDAVVLWVTNTVERDYRSRGVFQAIRDGCSEDRDASSLLFFVTPEFAEEILEDAEAHRQSPNLRRGLKVAYNSHIAGIRYALDEARDRAKLFALPQAICTYQSDMSEKWLGTKQQLLELGIHLDRPWPSEPGGKDRSDRGLDWRGYKSSIAPYSRVWPGLFEVEINIPYEVWGRKMHGSREAAERDESLQRARRTLAAIPESPDEFRMETISTIRSYMRIVLDWSSTAREHFYHGYSFTDDALEAIQCSFDAVAEAIAEATVTFDTEKHDTYVQSVRAEIAALDPDFQKQISQLTKPNFRILKGDAQ